MLWLWQALKTMSHSQSEWWHAFLNMLLPINKLVVPSVATHPTDPPYGLPFKFGAG